MYALRPISHDSVPGALAKAERYRLLNEPGEAESICRDILDLEPGNQQALINLILALTDQIPHDSQSFSHAMTAVSRLDAEYDRAYYAGIAWERRAKARYHHHGSSRSHVHEWMSKALGLFDHAAELRAQGNDDAVLRWNACVRFLARHKDIVAEHEDQAEPILSE